MLAVDGRKGVAYFSLDNALESGSNQFHCFFASAQLGQQRSGRLYVCRMNDGSYFAFSEKSGQLQAISGDSYQPVICVVMLKGHQRESA